VKRGARSSTSSQFLFGQFLSDFLGATCTHLENDDGRFYWNPVVFTSPKPPWNSPPFTSSLVPVGGGALRILCQWTSAGWRGATQLIFGLIACINIPLIVNH